MHKILCLRGRRGDGWYGQCRRANRTEDQMPSFEGMKVPYYDFTKYSKEYLGPMRRWLRSQVGRPWNDVYSEICRVIKPDSKRGCEIRKEIVAIQEGKSFKARALFIHPERGTLCIASEASRQRLPDGGPRAKFTSVQKWLPKDMLLLKLDGKWFRCRMARYAQCLDATPLDVVFNVRLIESHATQAYGRPLYCVRKCRLTRKELQARGLRNSASGADGFLTVVGPELLGRIRRSHGNPIWPHGAGSAVFRILFWCPEDAAWALDADGQIVRHTMV